MTKPFSCTTQYTAVSLLPLFFHNLFSNFIFVGLCVPTTFDLLKNSVGNREIRHNELERDLFDEARDESANLRFKSGCAKRECDLSAWIEADFQPWEESGITKKMIERALNAGGETNRFVIINQKLYMTERRSKSKWGDSKRWYFAYGLLELLEKYGNEVPDVDIVINGGDYPLSSKVETYHIGKALNKRGKRAVVRRSWNESKLKAPPVVFSIARRDGFLDILWPQNNVWGMDWKGMGMRERPWCIEFQNLVDASLHVPFSKRRAKLFWRGQLRSNANERGGLIRCKSVILPKLGRKFDANLFDVAANGVVVGKGGRRIPGVSTRKAKQISAKERCRYKYLIHVEGMTYSLAQLPQALCGSIMLMSKYRYYTVFERAYRANGFYLPIAKPMFDRNAKAVGIINEKEACANISDVLVWAENESNRGKIESILQKSREWVMKEYGPEGISKYMMNVLKKYKSLMRFKPEKIQEMRGPVSIRDVKKNTKRREKCPS